MPFKSEAQRRYLWANEPEIARDWADTYGSRIQKENGGIMRLGFQNGNEVDDEESWWEWLREKGGQLPSMAFSALSGIPGLGFLLNAARPSPIDRYNQSRWSVHGKGLPGTRHVSSFTPMKYYDTLRHGTSTVQDPFGINTVSMFGNYQKHYEDYVNEMNKKIAMGYVPKGFQKDKYNYGKEVLGITPSSSNIAGTPLITSTSEHRDRPDRPDRRPDKPGGFTDPGKGSYGPHMADGGLINFYKNGGFLG
tara:strand:- start:39 stop:788 length:750 start_codon:yes stop_codon:yes gene_type:complete